MPIRVAEVAWVAQFGVSLWFHQSDIGVRLVDSIGRVQERSAKPDVDSSCSSI